jgi:multiple sugar transport system substrate-binding protein
MKDKQPRIRRSRFLRRLNTPVVLGLLAIAQAVILVLLLLNLLKSPVTVADSPSEKPPIAGSPVTLSFAVPPLEVTHQNWKPLIDAFESKNPDIHIEVVPGSDATDALKAVYTTEFKNAEAKQTYTSYDLIYTDIVWVAEFASAGWLKELPPIPQAELDLFLPKEVEAGRYQDKLYRLPFRADVGLLYYRKDLLKAAGRDLPDSFPALIETAQTLQNQKRAQWGFVWQGENYEGLVANFFEVLQDQGGFWIKTDSREVGLDQPEAIAAAQFLLNTVKKGVSPGDVITFKELDALERFKQGNTGFLRNWSYAWTMLESDSLSQSQVGVQPIMGACRGGWGFAIAQRSQYPDAAFRAMQFFASEDAQRQFISKDSYMPTIKTLFRDPEIVRHYPYFPALIETFQNSALRPAIPEYEQVSKILQDQLSKMLRGQLSPEEAMREAADQTRKHLQTSKH